MLMPTLKQFADRGLLAVAIVLVLGAAGCATKSTVTSGQYDELAQRLTKAGARVYGASQCSACQYQKQLFGNSWQYINYVECAIPAGRGQAQACSEAGIMTYPTWVFPDGERISGVRSPEDLEIFAGFKLVLPGATTL